MSFALNLARAAAAEGSFYRKYSVPSTCFSAWPNASSESTRRMFLCSESVLDKVVAFSFIFSLRRGTSRVHRLGLRAAADHNRRRRGGQPRCIDLAAFRRV